jgi:hypothetical protein
MKKKLFAISIVLLMITVIIPLNTLGEHSKIDLMSSLKDNKVSSNIITQKIFERRIWNFSDGSRFYPGLARINSTGKGFHLLIPLRLLKINLPIPTIQYFNIFPWKIDLFLTLCIYCDENAKTVISKLNSSGKWENITDPIVGNHSIIIGMIKMPSIGMLRNLIDDGIIDGIQPVQQFFTNWFGLIGLQNFSAAGIIRWIRDKIIFKDTRFEGGIIDINNSSTVKLLKAMTGVPPRYKGGPILNETLVNCIWNFSWEYFPLFTKIFGEFLQSQIRYNLIYYSGYIWNNFPLRTSFLHLAMPQQLLGFSPFIWWTKSPKILPIVNCLQKKILEGIFYDRLDNPI